jgi:hypothetical protein
MARLDGPGVPAIVRPIRQPQRASVSDLRYERYLAMAALPDPVYRVLTTDIHSAHRWHELG